MGRENNSVANVECGLNCRWGGMDFPKREMNANCGWERGGDEGWRVACRVSELQGKAHRERQGVNHHIR